MLPSLSYNQSSYNMKTSILSMWMFFIPLFIYGQTSDSLTIEACFKFAMENSPLSKQYRISEDALSYRIKNLNSNWLPATNINAQALYNSETIDFSDLIEGIPVDLPTLDKDQYKFWAEINQTIYDGGLTKARKNIERKSYEAETYQTNTDLLLLKQKVNQVYFSLLISSKSIETVTITLDDLREKKKIIGSGVENGALLPDYLLSINAEEIRLEQQILEMEMSRRQLFNTLSILMDTVISENTILSLPEDVYNNNEINRPELLLFAMQKEKIDAGKKLITATDMPRVFAFSQAAYGRPGYNMISRDFHTFYSAGVGLTWDFMHYGESKRKKQLLDLQKEQVDIKQENFNDLLNIQLESEALNIIKYEEMISKDERILELRKQVSEAAFAKLQQGVITSTEYISEHNNEMIAYLQLENHKILKLQAEYNLQLLKGNL